jgi:hypothetical protein
MIAGGCSPFCIVVAYVPEFPKLHSSFDRREEFRSSNRMNIAVHFETAGNCPGGVLIDDYRNSCRTANIILTKYLFPTMISFRLCP